MGMTNQAKKLAAKLAEKQGRYVEMREASGEAGRADHMRDRQYSLSDRHPAMKFNLAQSQRVANP
jgi:hypothetical protein